MFSGLTNPTAMRFASDGRVFVTEKSGLIKVFDSLSDPSPSVFADLRSEVYNFWDRGLLGFALDPGFPRNPVRVRALFVRRSPRRRCAALGHGRLSSDPCPTPPGPTSEGCVISARLSRIGGPAGATYQAEVLADGPAGYWRLGEASGTVAADTSPNANSGAYVSGPTLGAPAPLVADSSNRAVAFNGTAMSMCRTRRQ